MRPIASGERNDRNAFYHLVDWDAMPEGTNCVYTVWVPTWKERFLLFIGFRLWIGQKTVQVRQRVVVAKRLGKPDKNGIWQVKQD